jgi:putative hydrolase of the HAD superfamily
VAIRAVVFDLFDTLVDLRYEDLPRLEHEGRRIGSTTGALHAAVGTRAALSFPEFAETLLAVDRELYESRGAQGLEVPTQERFTALVERLGLEDPELPAILTGVHMGMLRDTVRVPEHHADVLARLGRRVRLGLCSNFTHSETALAILEETGLRHHLGAVVISDAVGFRKPRAEIFAAVLRELGVAPEECLHVGDNLRADVGGARSAGMATAWITRRVAEPERLLGEFDGPRPDWCIRDLAELHPLLSRGDTR